MLPLPANTYAAFKSSLYLPIIKKWLTFNVTLKEGVSARNSFIIVYIGFKLSGIFITQRHHKIVKMFSNKYNI